MIPEDVDSPEKRGRTLRDGLSAQFEPSHQAEPDIAGSESQRYFRTYRIMKQFPATGGEADIWLIQKDRVYYILKH